MMDPESRPYTALYVEGRGYFQYLHMPFVLTGAPSTFGTVTADNMFDLLVEEIMELFVMTSIHQTSGQQSVRSRVR